MRREFVESLVSIAEADERVVLLTGDLGFAALEPFSERFPDRFFNAGVAEQNMVGMATGMAEAGLTPYVYSISTFASMRAYEFIRNGPVLHDLPVRIVGIGEGADYSHNGITHYALEDVALMRAQPGLALVNPASSGQVAPLMRAVQDQPGPAYIRLSKQSCAVPGLPDEFELGRAQRIGDGDDVAIVALGAMATNAVACAELLAERGVRASVVVVASVSPAPIEDLTAWLSPISLALTVEAHYITGGVGSLVAEVIAEQGLQCRLVRAGAKAAPVGMAGSLGYMHEQLGLSPERLADRVLEALQATRGAVVL
ncbi:MAG: 1-deoxy-D-xylulose-5-phosphate synthase [Actinomycetota bacterium]|nr:1-deoxy-D-xylulose-5-phosphate synthase [Actinomycetota bacterium]